MRLAAAAPAAGSFRRRAVAIGGALTCSALPGRAASSGFFAAADPSRHSIEVDHRVYYTKPSTSSPQKSFLHREDAQLHEGVQELSLKSDLIPPAKNQTRAAPYVSDEECTEFAASIYRKPAVVCSRVEVDADTDGCKCKVVLPASIHPVPDTMESVIDAPQEPALPGQGPPRTFDPPAPPARAVNNLAPYSPPHMVGTCPFQAKCENEQTCVGFNSWGFQKVMQSNYSAVANLLNTIYCMYYMPMDSKFEIPLRVRRARELEQEGK
ncbi:unnamed protein product [Amoebophrya sp. A120]|nr:unnamed protein product [Amoebophrya sp. A120]|eukprot:GSA120T00017060001.1